MNALIAALALSIAAPASTDAGSVSDDAVFSAMRDELSRSKKLNLPESAAPYYVDYNVLDIDALSIHASFGALINSAQTRVRLVAPAVRVGNYERDANGYANFDGTAPFEDDYRALRRRFWLATDSAYKSAATNFREQQAQDKQTTRDEDAPDSFAKHPAVVHLDGTGKVTRDRKALEKIARVASEVFKAYPDIQGSGVSVGTVHRVRRFANSEGTLTRGGGELLTVSLVATGQAKDGARIHATRELHTLSGQPPSEATIVAAAKEAAADFLALQKAPAMPDYTGPILFEREAGAEITAFMLGSLFTTGGWAADLEARMGQRVLPKGYSVIDDPTMAALDGVALHGTTAVDEEGVKAERVVLVDDGRLEALLSTRTPSKKHPRSNGHARGGTMGWTRPAPSNFFLKAKGGTSDAALMKKLKAQMKREGLQHAIVVTRIGETPWAPAEAYRVDASGKRERVRIGNMERLELRAFRDIIAASKAQHRLDYLAINGDPARGLPTHMLAFAAPTTVVAPALLLREAVIHKDTSDKPKPPLYAHPHFAK